MAFTTTMATFAQNANRSGFFLEAGVGNTVGSTPRTSFSINNEVFSVKCRSGMMVDFSFGARFRVSPHWAYEIKATAQSNADNITDNLVGRGLPIGFRYTSVEVWRNFSLYCHFNAGVAVAANTGKFGYAVARDMTEGMTDVKLKGYEDAPGLGAAYSLGIGVNITTHFYLEYCWDAQYMFNCYGKNGKENLHWGMSGVAVGYRF